MPNKLAALSFLLLYSLVNGSWLPVKDVSTPLAEQRQEELDQKDDEKEKNVQSQSLIAVGVMSAGGVANESFVSMASSCPQQSFQKRNGPVYVSFDLPQSNYGAILSFEAGRAYRLEDDTCYSLNWSDHSFECNEATGKFIQLEGDWSNLEYMTTGCEDGVGMIINHEQPNLKVDIGKPLLCPATTFDVHNSPIHVRFSLPEGGQLSDIFTFSAGNAGRKTGEDNCTQITWTDLAFECDPISVEWTLVRGFWTKPQPLDCDAWYNESARLVNANQTSLQVVDTTDDPHCRSVKLARHSGPIRVEMNLPSDYSIGSSINYKAGEVFQWFNDKCFVLQWTDHEFVCDVFIAKWIPSKGSFVIPDQTPLQCTALGDDYAFNDIQPHLTVIDLTQLDDTPTPSPTVSISPTTAQGGTHIPTESPVFFIRPLETNVPQQPTSATMPSIPTEAPAQLIRPLETGIPQPTYDIILKNPLTTPLPTTSDASAMITTVTNPPTETAKSPPTTSPTEFPSEPPTRNPSLRPTSVPPTFAPTTARPSLGPALAISATQTPTISASGGPSSTFRFPTREPLAASNDEAAAATPTPTPGGDLTFNFPTREPAPSVSSMPTSSLPTDAPETDTISPTEQQIIDTNEQVVVSETLNPTDDTTPTGTPTSAPFHCGCPRCTDTYWNREASGFSCGERIEYIVNMGGGTEAAACAQVAGEEFTDICSPFCDPLQCLKANLTDTSLSQGSSDSSPSQAPSERATLILSTDAESPAPTLGLVSASRGLLASSTGFLHPFVVLAFAIAAF